MEIVGIRDSRISQLRWVAIAKLPNASCVPCSHIRPIFNDVDDEQMEIRAAVVAFTLRLHYDDRQGSHSLSVALDETDVHTLKYQCERALQKAQIAQGRMRDMAGVPTIISGEAHDESGD